MKRDLAHADADEHSQELSREAAGAAWVVRPTFQLPLPLGLESPRVQEKDGAVFTKAWVVEMILELAGYSPHENLVDARAIEPSAGDGAFLVPMALRLLQSCRRQQRPVTDLMPSLRAYELDDTRATTARRTLCAALVAAGLTTAEATALCEHWIVTGDYLTEAPTSPAADFVIGNPPYIRLEDIDGQMGAAYRGAYSTMQGRADLYVAFIEAGLRQLKQHGVLALICADRWMLNRYGSALRTMVTRGFSVESVVEMHTADAFEDGVSAYPAVIVIRRATQGAVAVASAGPTAGRAGGAVLASALSQVRTHATHARLPEGLRAAHVASWFTGNEPWPSASPQQLALLRELEASFAPLESEKTNTAIGIGVATGADKVYLTTDPQLVEDSRLLPVAMTADLTSGTLRWSGHYLVNPWTEAGLAALAAYPRLERYYVAHEATLNARNIAKRHPMAWYRTIDRVHLSLLKTPKLYIVDIGDRLNPVLDRGLTYPHHNLYFVHSSVWDIEVLGGLLLSDVAHFFIACYSLRMRGGWLRFQAQYLRRIRVPQPWQIAEKEAHQLKAAFRARDRAAATQIALRLYGIDPARWEDARA